MTALPDPAEGGPVFADYLDGRHPVVHRVTLVEAEGALRLRLPEGGEVEWPLAEVRLLPDQAAGATAVLARQGGDPARVVVEDPALAAALGRRFAPLAPPQATAALRRRLAALSAMAVAAVATIIFVLIPVMANQLAAILPAAGEKALGDSTFEQIRQALGDGTGQAVRICDSPEGSAALARMTARLTADAALPYPVQVHVLDHRMVNAFALPGGHVTLFDGLLRAAEAPEEVAAVLAHEIGHVAHRDPARIALRSAGSIGVLGLLLGDFAGGTAVLFLAERLIQASYSQDAEAAADGYAHALLLGADLPPGALAAMFRRLQARGDNEEGILAHFLSHPRMARRISAAEAAEAAAGRRAFTAVLDAAEWRALRDICRPAARD
jgi:Zn-dependent protease with chaperone function